MFFNRYIFHGIVCSKLCMYSFGWSRPVHPLLHLWELVLVLQRRSCFKVWCQPSHWNRVYSRLFAWIPWLQRDCCLAWMIIHLSDKQANDLSLFSGPNLQRILYPVSNSSIVACYSISVETLYTAASSCDTGSHLSLRNHKFLIDMADCSAWQTHQQYGVDAFSTETECIAVADTYQDGFNMHHFIDEIIQASLPIHMHVDKLGSRIHGKPPDNEQGICAHRS